MNTDQSEQTLTSVTQWWGLLNSSPLSIITSPLRQAKWEVQLIVQVTFVPYLIQKVFLVRCFLSDLVKLFSIFNTWALRCLDLFSGSLSLPPTFLNIIILFWPWPLKIFCMTTLYLSSATQPLCSTESVELHIEFFNVNEVPWLEVLRFIVRCQCLTYLKHALIHSLSPWQDCKPSTIPHLCLTLPAEGTGRVHNTCRVMDLGA